MSFSGSPSQNVLDSLMVVVPPIGKPAGIDCVTGTGSLQVGVCKSDSRDTEVPLYSKRAMTLSEAGVP